ncbi:GntR family transcriptional regulator [Kaustia mangrovi]|uniref:GntR family transcriptional regulator n=1 Tax=Kaustia mangrovi TaxID=2593653 RepID=A0A7S8C577_9HYPH|nr:GntR family transcriptional regulator [Kaustia mangrovi]QPC43628.1 GntR family transcriptional regulator [Kaustia mangrovi]
MPTVTDDMLAEEPIVRRSLHDELLDRLRRMIVDGELTPGEKVPEKALCARFNVSRTPLREALKVLASEGLVALEPNRGATVTRLTAEDLEETFPIMGALEAVSGELACAQITEEEIAEIRALHEEMVGHYRRGEMKPYFALNQEIHERILDAARNQTLATIYRGLAGRVRRARYLANMSAERWARAVAEHEEILAALEARDGQRLARILKRHLAGKLQTIRESLMTEPEAR